jgi:hypothetical protein
MAVSVSDCVLVTDGSVERCEAQATRAAEHRCNLPRGHRGEHLRAQSAERWTGDFGPKEPARSGRNVDPS